MDGESAMTWGQQNFGDLKLGDARRSERLPKLVDAMCKHPGGSLPDKLSNPADLRAFYRIMRAKKVTHETVMASHYRATHEAVSAVAEEGTTVLILHDATELDYTTITTLKEQLGQIGEGTHRGYICHNSLAIRADTKETLGLRVWEPHPPEGAEALEWILLTDVEPTTPDEARERVRWYECRPVIEEFHKGMKTGCSVEGMQFTKIVRLEPAIGVLSALATTLMKLRDAARIPDAETRPASEVVSTEYIEVLKLHYPQAFMDAFRSNNSIGMWLVSEDIKITNGTNLLDG